MGVAETYGVGNLRERLLRLCHHVLGMAYADVAQQLHRTDAHERLHLIIERGAPQADGLCQVLDFQVGVGQVLFDIGQQLLHHQLVAVNDVGGAQSQHVAVLFPGFLFRLFGSRFCVLGPVHLFEQQDVEQLGPPRLPKRRVDVER